jgi:hypothetical protein
MKPLKNICNLLTLSLLISMSACYSSRGTVVDNVLSGEHFLCSNQGNSFFPFPSAKAEFEKKTEIRQYIEQYLTEYEKSGKSPLVNFHVKLYSGNPPTYFAGKWINPEKLMVEVEVYEKQDGTPPLVLGKRFKIGDQFTFKGMTWKILNLGTDGLWYKDRQEDNNICRLGFVHIKEVGYELPKTLKQRIK